MTDHRIYKFTSIGRPLDPDWPSNKAVLILLPVTAVLGVAWFLFSGLDIGVAFGRSLTSVLAVFGCWALARELLPDDHAAAFVSMALGFFSALAYSNPSLILLFTTLGLVRIVNRSTGLQARTSDSILVTLLVIWTLYATESPWFGAVGSLAFFLDGLLKNPQKKQWIFSLVCLMSMVIYIIDHDVIWWWLFVPDTLLEWIALLAMFLFAINLLRQKKIHSKGDASGERLELERVKSGMAIGILATLQGLDVMPQVILLVATIGGICIGMTFRRSFKNPAKGLRSS